MTISRRRMLASLISATAVGIQSARANVNASRYLIVTASHDGPHLAAIEGIQSALGAHAVQSAIYRLPNDEAALRADLNGAAPSPPVIAVGVEAVKAMATENGRSAVLATMVFREDLAKLRAGGGQAPKLAGAVWLDLPVPQIISGVRFVFPDSSRFAVICNRSQMDAEDVSSVGRQVPVNVTVKPVLCESASDLLTALRKLRGQVDFVICRPDANLYNKTTAEPLILASLEHKLLLIGFSASFVRAGAGMGVYPDFADVGRQTAAMCERGVGAAASREEHPRKTNLAINERVLHLLGRESHAKYGDDVLVIR